MNAQQLSKRLRLVASYIPEGAVVADIGSDHAYLPCFLVHQDVAKSAIAGEVVQGPYDSARRQVMAEGLTDQITVRLADGLAAVKPEDEVTAVTIAGMGGPLIRTILENGKKQLTGVERLVLQPNIHALSIRQWAVENGWVIKDEAILKESGKIYEVLVLERSTEPFSLSPEEILLGPVLMRRKDPVFKEKWSKELRQWEDVLQSMEKAEETPELLQKKQELQEKIRLTERVLKDENPERL